MWSSATPSELLADLDREAARRGIARQSLIKVWLYERLHSDSITVLGESASERVTSGIIRPQDWPKETSGLRESIISILKSKGQALSVLDLARELENSKEPRTQSTKNVGSAKGRRAAKRLIREGK